MSEETTEQPNLSKKEQKQVDIITRANEATERLNAASDRMEQLTARLAELKVENMFAGQAEAGQEEPVEETPQEYAQRVMGGQQ